MKPYLTERLFAAHDGLTHATHEPNSRYWQGRFTEIDDIRHQRIPIRKVTHKGTK